MLGYATPDSGGSNWYEKLLGTVQNIFTSKDEQSLVQKQLETTTAIERERTKKFLYVGLGLIGVAIIVTSIKS